jgi:hypothetical protein
MIFFSHAFQEYADFRTVAEINSDYWAVFFAAAIITFRLALKRFAFLLCFFCTTLSFLFKITPL